MSGIVNLGGRKSTDGGATSRATATIASGAPSASGSGPSSSAANAAQSSAAAKGTSEKSVHDAKCGGLVGWFRRLAILDKCLVVAVVFFLAIEAHGQYKKHQEGQAADGDGSASSSAFKLAPGSWQARAVIVLILGSVSGGLAFCCLGCFHKRRARSATSHLRVRGDAGGSAVTDAVGCCGRIANFWRSLAMLDKFLVTVLLVFGAGDSLMQAKEAGLHEKIQDLPAKTLIMLRGTPAPTSAPTPVPPPPPEDPAVVLADIESRVGDDKQAKPPACTEDDFAKIKATGMIGDACRGQPYTQACATSQLSKVHKPTWLTADFAKEMTASHQALNDVNTTSTFLGVVLGEQFGDDCGKVEATLAPLLADEGATAELLKSPKLLCNGGGFMADDAKTKWGVQPSQDGATGVAITQSAALSGKTFDNFVRDAKLSHEIKDYVHVGMTTPALLDGIVTFARTRYISFQHDWQGYWESVSLSDVVTKLDGVGHTCYWPGDDKLWRITECWQDFYGYKTYGFVVCVNRNLAPQLHERMEAKFKATIGA